MNNPKKTKSKLSRREFAQLTGTYMALGMAGLTSSTSIFESNRKQHSKISIKRVDANFEREPLTPYHFKGSFVTELWQTIARLESESGHNTIGLGTQSVLWSDSKVFMAHSESGGNALMYALSEKALQLIKGNSFADPIELLDNILPEVYEYGKKITGNPDLRKTFALNSLVCVDNAAWLLYARENNISSFDDMVPGQYKAGLSYRHNKVASIPSFSAGTNPGKIKASADEGYFIMKLKMGSAGDQKEMLEKDMEFLSAIHKTIGHYKTPYTKNGKIPYYLDPNGRYEKKETLLRYLDHARKIGAFEQIALIEEPFAESNEVYVGDIGVTIAADESAHTVEDAARRIEQGYKALVLKCIAKTLSMTLKIAKLAYEKKIPCFCADLTVNPVLVDWNKSVAARLQPFPNMDIGLLETNGHQYYKNWDKMLAYHPKAGSKWTQTQKGIFYTDNSFYEESGGIFQPSAHYEQMFKRDSH
jgi:L-alanine-DL-glutamate epimerase-like enolase superfamily enzyme